MTIFMFDIFLQFQSVNFVATNNSKMTNKNNNAILQRQRELSDLLFLLHSGPTLITQLQL